MTPAFFTHHEPGRPRRHRREGDRLNIWTERLERGHLPLLERWIGRGDGELTANDLPTEAERLAAWYERAAAEPGRLDCLTLVYETPVGVAGVRRIRGQEAELYLLLGETGYNALRTATYVSLRMLDRAFGDLGSARVTVQVRAEQAWFSEVLERMGFIRTAEGEKLCALAVEKEHYLSRKYLF